MIKDVIKKSEEKMNKTINSLSIGFSQGVITNNLGSGDETLAT